MSVFVIQSVSPFRSPHAVSIDYITPSAGFSRLIPGKYRLVWLGLTTKELYMEKEKRRLMSNIRNNCKKGRDSLRRWLSLLCLCLLAAVPAARAESLPAAISQRDSRFHTSDYRYGDRVFKENGCGPALLTNALLASLRITDEDQAAALMLDMMRLLCAPEDTSMVKLQLYCLGYLTEQAIPPWGRRFMPGAGS